MTPITWANCQVTLGELHPWGDNPRLSTKAQARRMLESWQRFGQVQTIAIGPGGQVYDGHQRLSALLTLHGKSYQVDARRSDRELTDEERRALVVTLHAGAVGSWNWDNLANWDAGELQEWGFDSETLTTWQRDVGALGNLLQSEEADSADAEPQVDRAAELNEKWQVRPGDLWRIGEHRLACGDCTDRAVVERVMAGEKADVVFIDPPYMTFGSSTGKLTPGDFSMLVPFWDGVFKTAQENLKSGRAAFVCCDWRTYPLLFNAALKVMSVKNLIVWDMGGALKMGTGGFRFSYELIVYATNAAFGRNWKTDGEGSWEIKDRSIRDLWTIRQREAAPGINRDHASQKPTELIEFALTNASQNGEGAFDYFLGSGTTLVACQNLGRRGRGIEISPEYCAVVLQRMSDAFPGIEIERVVSA